MKRTVIFMLALFPMALATVYAGQTAVVTEQSVKLVVKDRNGAAIPQWSNPSVNVHVEVQLFKPAGNAKKTAVVVIPGSGGGLPADVAAAFAAKGHPALAVQYFDYSPNSDYVFSITQLPLETFQTAIKWLKARQDIEIDKVVMHGRSRGGEAALLVGVYFPGLLDGIIAEVPSAYAWGDRANGIWSQYIALQPNPNRETSSWTFRGQELPFVRMKGWLQTYSGETTLENLPLYSYTPAYKKAVAEERQARLEAARIKVENIRVPILVTGGGKDQLWHSGSYAQKIRNHRKNISESLRAKDKYIIAEDAGHIWDATVTTPIFFPSGVYDFAKPDFSNICAEPNLPEFLNQITPMPEPTPTGPSLVKGFPYQGHIDEIIQICSAPDAYLDYYMAPEFAANGGTPEENGHWGNKATTKIDEFLSKLN